MTLYIESSAAAKLLVAEKESPALQAALDAWRDADEHIVSCALLETELRRFASRVDIAQGAVSTVLSAFDIAAIDRSLYAEAGLLPGRSLRSLDALHVAAALRAQVRALITYDTRQAEAAAAAGIPVLAPL